MVREIINKDLGKGIVNIPSDAELIPAQAAQDSLGFISTDGEIELCKGRILLGAEETTAGYIKEEIFGYKIDGTAVHFRKKESVIQYYNTTTFLWVDIVTGLTASAEYSFSRYQSIAGSFVYATGVDGIYKLDVTSPGDYCSMYDDTKNFKGKSMIGTSRMFLWDRAKDRTGLYCSYIDLQDSSVFTTVTAEATTSLSGTLAFKAGDAKRTCFAVVITLTGTGEVFADNRSGVLVGTLGNTATINYTTGAYTISVAGVGTVDYSWEMSNNKGVTDFTYSATRTAGQGNVFRQDEGGDAIQSVEIYNGKFYSFKKTSVYELEIADTDLTATNKIFRRDIGLAYWRSSISTSKGVVFMDTGNPEKPQLTILQQNTYGDNIEPATLANHFNFADYEWDAAPMGTFGEYIVLSARTPDSSINNKMFLYNLRRDTVDILPYGARTIVSSAGLLYIGDSYSDNSYEILSGFDDDNATIENYWISNDEKYNVEKLKKLKKLRLKGLITKDQVLEVYISYDNEPFNLVGTIRGDGGDVDIAESYMIGMQGIGRAEIGAETDTINGSFYLAELKLKSPKFRKRTLKLTATGIGYLSVNMIDDFNVKLFADKLPSKYRLKQNVSLDGTLTDQ